MKKAVLAFAALATAAAGFAAPALAAENGLLMPVQYYDDGGYRPPRRDVPPPPPGWGGPARPGPYWGHRGPVGPRDVARMLRSRGYLVGDIRRDHGNYFVRATRPDGRPVIVMIDAFSGRILGERRPGRY
ncbi:MAG: antifreeze protein [Rhizobiales bacterium]|nr:antifreeze protein [Hyphomicrobiales bacterium]OJY01315.1 MAG: antifreeze protein [Rhizobiales bacterium 63-22]